MVDGVVQFAVSIGKLFAVYHQLETLGQFGVRAVTFAQRRHFYRVVGDKRRLNVRAFAFFAEYFVYQLTFTHGVVDLYIKFLSYLAYLFFGLTHEIIAGMFLDGIEHSYSFKWGFERYDIIAYLQFGSAVHVEAYLLYHLFGKLHHPVVVLVGYIYLHCGEFGVVSAVHSLVAEVFGELVDALEAAYNEAFEIQFIGNTQVKRYIQSIVMGYKRTGSCTTRYWLQYGGFDLDIIL